MKKIVMLLIMAAVLVFPSLTYAEEKEVTVLFYQTEARSILDAVNELRTGENAWYWNEDNESKTFCTDLEPLEYDYNLEQTAMLRAAELSELFSHTRPNGERFSTAFADLGYNSYFNGENIAAGVVYSSDAFFLWSEEGFDYSGQGHRRAMLSAGFNRIGVGFAIVNGTGYWAMELAHSTEPAGPATNMDIYTVVTVNTDPDAENRDFNMNIIEKSGDLYYYVKNGQATIIDCDPSAEYVYVPESIDGYPVTTIGPSAFYSNENLLYVSLPDSITCIEKSAFAGCRNLSNITIPSGVKSIGWEAFAACEGFTEILIPEGIEKISGHTFLACYNLADITLPSTLSCIEEFAFAGCGMSSIYIPAGVTNIENEAFFSCIYLTDIYYGGSESQWAEIRIESNDEIENAVIHYAAENLNEKSGWADEDGNWYYYINGEKATGWVEDAGSWYYMDSDGLMSTGWIFDGSDWYYMQPWGSMATGWINDGGEWYYIQPWGTMAIGWVNDGSAWYYMQPWGTMAIGWINDGGAWYYMSSSGTMVTGSVNIDGTDYLFDSNGAWIG